MDDKKGNIILGIILAILMVIAIVIVIINPNKVETVNYDAEKNIQQENNIVTPTVKQTTSTEELQKEEKQNSMQVGGKFCKIGNTAVFYEEKDKSVYMYNLENNTTSKIATLATGAEKIYFDGENIYAIPSYQSGKGIYKIDLTGNTQKIYNDSSLQLWLTDDKIYFVRQIGYDTINQNPQGTLCSIDKDGTNIKNIAESVKNYFFIQNDKIYYTTQTRKMYQINTDGTEQLELVQGRKFVQAVNDKYLIYIDYADQESEHMINLETKEDVVIGYYGIVDTYVGKTYVNARKRLDDGSIEQQFTLFEIDENGKINEIGKVDEKGTSLKYIVDGKIYTYTQSEGTYVFNVDDKQKQSKEEYNGYDYFVGGYGYKIDDSNLDEIKVNKIEL